jgi:hypothetical protein
MKYEQNEQFVIEAVDVAGIDMLEEDIAPVSCCCSGGGCCNGRLE